MGKKTKPTGYPNAKSKQLFIKRDKKKKIRVGKKIGVILYRDIRVDYTRKNRQRLFFRKRKVSCPTEYEH